MEQPGKSAATKRPKSSPLLFLFWGLVSVFLDFLWFLWIQNRGHYKNFHDMVKEFQSTLRHDDYVVSVDLATNLTWLETYITSMEYQDNTTYR